MSLDKLNTTITEAGEVYLDELEFSFRKLTTSAFRAVEEAQKAGVDGTVTARLAEGLLENLQLRVEAMFVQVLKELGQ